MLSSGSLAGSEEQCSNYKAGFYGREIINKRFLSRNKDDRRIIYKFLTSGLCPGSSCLYHQQPIEFLRLFERVNVNAENLAGFQVGMGLRGIKMD